MVKYWIWIITRITTFCLDSATGDASWPCCPCRESVIQFADPRGGLSDRFVAWVVRIYIQWNVVPMKRQSGTFGTPDCASSSTTPSSAPKPPTRWVCNSLSKKVAGGWRLSQDRYQELQLRARGDFDKNWASYHYANPVKRQRPNPGRFHFPRCWFVVNKLINNDFLVTFCGFFESQNPQKVKIFL